MVSTLWVLSGTAAILLATLSVQADPALVPAPTETLIHSLFKRQAFSAINVDSLPEQCKSPCKATNPIAGCTTDQCICTDKNMGNLGKCLTCAIKTGSIVTSQSTAQGTVDRLTNTCNARGLKVKSVTLGSTSNSASHSGLLSSRTLAAAALGAILAQAA